MAEDSIELQGVYDVIHKWYHMKDMKRVDVLLASALSMCAVGCDPLMIIFCGNSGDWKSEGLRALSNCNLWISELNKLNSGKPKWVRTVDQLTKNTFVSGKPGNKGKRNDLGSELDGKYTLLLIADFANIVSKIKEDKNEIFSQLRNLYDGFLQKDTGSGVKKFYTDCHITLVANATPMIKDEFYLHQALGTRELVYDTSESLTRDEKKIESVSKAKKSWENQQVIEQARRELVSVFTRFLIQHTFKEIDDGAIPDEMRDFIIAQSYKLSLLRATVKVDFYRNTVIGEPVIEEPTRLVHQFKLLYKSLKSLGPDYPDERIKSIIRHFVKSSCVPLRYKLLITLEKSKGLSFTATELAEKFKIDYKQIRLELDILWALNIITREMISRDSFETKYNYLFEEQKQLEVD